ncbi:MAG TPA: shikimate dehydrogenase, partial [Firmicutes bacterium]|nr:shikimate dehydrogenase [Bacillota bacterium]
AHSLSPLLYNTAFAVRKMNALYVACPVKPELVSEAVAGLRALNAGGANVTSPHKEAVIPCLDQMSDEAVQARSVNTIVNRAGKLIGETTDGRGFLADLEERAPSVRPGDPVLLIGAGGAARAVALALVRHGYDQLYIANRTIDKGRALADVLRGVFPGASCRITGLAKDELHQALAACRLTVYCLTVDPEPVAAVLKDPALPLAGKVFYDLRYNPAVSDTAALFRSRGGVVINGRGMLYHQAVFAFELFTGQKAPAEEMLAAYRKKQEKED